VPTNIAEGCGRSTDADLARFADIASGSASEVEYELLLARDLDYIDNKTYLVLIKDLFEIKRMLVGYVQYLRRNKDNKR
jgi:four helix bundle protein